METKITKFEIVNSLRIGDSYTDHIKNYHGVPKNHLFCGIRQHYDIHIIVITTYSPFVAIFVRLWQRLHGVRWSNKQIFNPGER